MKYSRIYILILLTSLCYSSPISDKVNKELLSLNKDAKGIEVEQSSDCDSLYFIKYYEEKDWFEWFNVVCIKNDEILWTVDPDSLTKAHLGMRIRSGRIFKLSNLNKPILEIFDASHQGNGSMYLFEIRYKELILFFNEEHTVDFHHERSGFLQDSSQVFKSGYLKPYYKDINGDGCVDIILKDSIQIYKADEFDTERLIATKPCERRFLWDTKKKCFIKVFSTDKQNAP